MPEMDSQPLVPHWEQPSFPDIQEVQRGEGFTTRSISKVTLPPFAAFAKLSFPPCDFADGPTYATVQVGRNQHINLNSDLVYINHSCEPSLIFDTANFNVLAGPNGLKAGEELTFFYPSTEWDMAQKFDCFCGKPTCRGKITGAKHMGAAQLKGLWLNGHIRELLEETEVSRNGLDCLKPSDEPVSPPQLKNGNGCTTDKPAPTGPSTGSTSANGLDGLKLSDELISRPQLENSNDSVTVKPAPAAPSTDSASTNGLDESNEPASLPRLENGHGSVMDKPAPAAPSTDSTSTNGLDGLKLSDEPVPPPPQFENGNGCITDKLAPTAPNVGSTSTNGLNGLKLADEPLSPPELENDNGGITGKPEHAAPSTDTTSAPPPETSSDPLVQVLREELQQAEKMVEKARAALASYLESSARASCHHRYGSRTASQRRGRRGSSSIGSSGSCCSPSASAAAATVREAALRRGQTSRERSSEMGGDTA